MLQLICTALSASVPVLKRESAVPLRRSSLPALASLALALSTANAIPLVGTTGANLIKFDSATPGTTTTVAITGLLGGETLVGIDYRPKNGLLYGTGNAGHLYTINPTTGAATKIGSGSFVLSGSEFGTAIDPVTDQLRIVGNTGANKRINLDTGLEIATDSLVEGGGTVQNPAQITGIAYSNAFFDASTRTCYAISANLDELYRIGDVNSDPVDASAGFLHGVGSLVLEGAIGSQLGFVIGPDGIGYAAINYTSEFALYKINLQQGFATKIGKIGNNPAVSSFRGLTAVTGPQTFSNTQPILIPAPGGTGASNGAPASVYPSTIIVSDLTGTIRELKVTLNDLRHHFPDDVDMVLQAPNGGPITFGFPANLVLFSDVGGSSSSCGAVCDNAGNAGTTGVTITLADNAASLLPNSDVINEVPTPLTTGSFRPTNYLANDPFPAPGPTPAYGHPATAGTDTFAGLFNRADPNGEWGLYIVDDSQNDTGRLNGGWSIEVNATPDCESTVCPPDIVANNNPGTCGRVTSFARATVTGACGAVTYSHEPGTFFPVGTTVVNITTAQGKNCSFEVTIKDAQAPTIACHQDITVDAPAGADNAVVTFADPDVGDNCGVSGGYSPASGSHFNIGTTTVTGTATDASGNTTTCSFHVTVFANGTGPTPTPGGTATPTPTATPDATATPGATPSTSNVLNISTRLRVETGENVLIGGFIITGNEQKKLIVRAIGPSLPVGDRLADPRLDLYSGSSLIASNNDWQSSLNKQEIIDSTIPPSNDLESAILGIFDPGPYTAIVSGADGGTGVGLVEVYDLSASDSARLANISTRGLVQTGENVMIGGFILDGPTQKTLVVRAIGPSLPVGNKLADPLLELHDENGVVVGDNDNWRSTQEAEIVATGVAPTEDAEAALVSVLSPGAYTAIVRGANEGSGVGLVEVYVLDN